MMIACVLYICPVISDFMLCLALCMLLAADEGDALELYSTYIALNSTHSVGVPDEIRHRIEGMVVGPT